MDYSTITVDECVEVYEKNGMAAVIEDGTVTGFIAE